MISIILRDAAAAICRAVAANPDRYGDHLSALRKAMGAMARAEEAMNEIEADNSDIWEYRP